MSANSSNATGPSVSIDADELRMLKRELAWNCWVAQGAWARLKAMKLKSAPSGLVPGTQSLANVESVLKIGTEAWAHVHALLGATATISRMLWPGPSARRATKDRAPLLLEKLQLPPLPELETRDARNAYEHIENDAPEWFTWARGRFPGRPLMGWQIGDGTPFGEENTTPEECFRYLDVDHWTIRVGQNPPLDLRSLMVAIELLFRNIPVDHGFGVGVPPKDRK